MTKSDAASLARTLKDCGLDAEWFSIAQGVCVVVVKLPNGNTLRLHNLREYIMFAAGFRAGRETHG